ncbi:hypothetical protein AB6D11_19225 [Vibrio splendidus]
MHQLHISDLHSYYAQGGNFLRMPLPLYQSFNALFESMSWTPDPTGVMNRLPGGWHSEDYEQEFEASVSSTGDDHSMSHKMNDEIMKRLTPELKVLVDEWLLSPMFGPFQEAYDFHMGFVDLWDGSEGIPWHSDLCDGVEMILIAYWSDRRLWKDDLGGQLYMGRRFNQSVAEDNHHLLWPSYPNERIETLACIEPRQQSVALVNNANPMFVHRCNRVVSDEKRITFTLGIKLRVREDLSTPAKVIWPY